MKIRIDDIYAAQNRIAPYVRPTPLRKSHTLSDFLDLPVWLKFETMHDTGAFKLRGAANKLLSLTDEQRQRGVITVSSGNHGRAVAYIARHLNIRAVVCVTEIIPAEKVEGLKAFGAEVVVHGQNQDAADAHARRLADKHGLVFVSPFDDPLVIAGQGTLGLELLAAQPNLDTVLIQVSGGGLMSGAALALKTLKPSIRVIGVSTEHGAAMLESIKAGHIVTVEEKPSIADALPGPIPADNQYTFNMCRDLVDEFVQVADADIERAMAYLIRHEKCVVEGGAAAGVAAMLSTPIIQESRAAATILTGNNIATERALAIYENAKETL
ncbi:threonine ammonia-lyase [Roseibium sp.]|uniref:threonine ammonia-lyase n=1 Tax=Roseibium sp. TaxID=1936156 RepID=UPI003B52B2D1